MKKWVVAILLLVSICGWSQVNNDSLVTVASEYARIGRYDEAIEVAKQAFNNDPTRGDVAVLIANVFSWKGDQQTAADWLIKARKSGCQSADYWDCYLNVLLRQSNFRALLTVCEELESTNSYNDSLNLLKKQLQAYEGLKMYQEALDVLKRKRYENFKEEEWVRSFKTGLSLSTQRHALLVHYLLDRFTGTATHQYASLGYQFKPDRNSYSLQLNYASRFGMNGLQLETSNYLMLGEKKYLYVNYGFSPSDNLFPEHRGGLEYYFSPVVAWEASLGARALYYPMAVQQLVCIFTAHTGWYTGNHWISLRPFWVVRPGAQSVSLITKYRYYGASAVDFWGAELGVGNSPDDVLTTSQSNFNELMAYRLRLEKSFRISSTVDMLAALGYSYEQAFVQQAKMFRSRLTAELSARYSF